jgi:hypothetical protein
MPLHNVRDYPAVAVGVVYPACLPLFLLMCTQYMHTMPGTADADGVEWFEPTVTARPHVHKCDMLRHCQTHCTQHTQVYGGSVRPRTYTILEVVGCTPGGALSTTVPLEATLKVKGVGGGAGG